MTAPVNQGETTTSQCWLHPPQRQPKLLKLPTQWILIESALLSGVTTVESQDIWQETAKHPRNLMRKEKK